MPGVSSSGLTVHKEHAECQKKESASVAIVLSWFEVRSSLKQRAMEGDSRGKRN